MQDSTTLIRETLTRGRPDRVGLFDHWWAETTRGWVVEGYPTTAEGHPVAPEEHFGYDMRSVGGWFAWLPNTGPEEVLEETDEWRVTRNGAGAAFKYWKHKSGTPEHIGFLMESREVWERDYRGKLQSLDTGRIDIAGARDALARARAEARFGFYGHVFVWEALRGSLGDVTMYESLLLDPGWIRDFCQVYLEFFRTHYDALFAEAGLPDGIWVYEDLGYRNGLLASSATLGELIFPVYAELVAYFHERGLPVVLHTCGGITEAVPLIVEAGFDALNPMEVKAGCDLLAFAERYGERLAFCGGLDVRVLETNDPATIRREVRDLVVAMKERGARWVFGTDHSVSPRVSYASYQLALDVYREHMVL